MRKAYWVACYRTISDPNALRSYSALAGPAIEGAGGHFLARGMAAEAHEAGWIERTVIVEFSSMAQAKAAYESPAYQKAIAAMNGAVERDFRIVEGM
jgi:uncharacterized protein (DUF1330 family)